MSDVSEPSEKPKQITHADIMATLMGLVNDCRDKDGTVFAITGLTITAEQARHLYKAHQMVDEHGILAAGRAKNK